MEQGVGSVFFLLGAGASVDSGMKTYRGGEEAMLKPTQTPPTSSASLDSDIGMEIMWEHLDELRKMRDNATLGPTYDRICEEMKAHSGNGLIVTQNVDSLVKKIDAITIELHGTLDTCSCMSCKKQYPVSNTKHKCIECGAWLRPDIVLLGEQVDSKQFIRIFTWISRNKPTVCYVIGTTLQFDYLHDIIFKCRKNGARIVHINTDNEYCWHQYRKKTVQVFGGQIFQKLVKRKKEDELRKAL